MHSHLSHPVWDIFIRLFHWTLAASILFAWWSGEEGGNWMDWHMQAGYLVLALMLFRLIWGFIGTPHARFRDFVRPPRETLNYARALLAGREAGYLGHNPLGGWMVVVLLVLCLVQAGTGLFATDDIFTEGPLTGLVSSDMASALTRIHKLNFNLLLAAVALHLAGVIYHQRFKREPLVQGMIHGRKPVTDAATVPAAGRIQPVPALLTIGSCAALFLLLVWLG
jgi:cytochrome b